MASFEHPSCAWIAPRAEQGGAGGGGNSVKPSTRPPRGDGHGAFRTTHRTRHAVTVRRGWVPVPIMFPTVIAKAVFRLKRSTLAHLGLREGVPRPKAGGLWPEAGGLWLEASGWRLEASGWWPEASGRWPEA